MTTRTIAVIVLSALAGLGGCGDSGALLHAAIEREDLSRVQTLLNRGVDPNSYYDEMHATTLAAMIGNTAILEELLKAGADPDGRTDTGSTGLMLAQDARVVRMLLDYGADVNAQNNLGRTALMYARGVAIGEMLLDAGADVYITDLQGRTALEYHERQPMSRGLVEIIRNRMQLPDE